MAPKLVRAARLRAIETKSAIPYKISFPNPTLS